MIKELLIKYKDFILYGIFGVLTTVVNVASYYIAGHMMGLSTAVSTVIAWFLAVLFAYLTNRKWVFHSEATGANEVLREILLFYGMRISTGVLDLVLMFVLVDMAGFNDILIKALSNIAVIILNYIASKLVIFRKRHVDGSIDR